MRFLFIIFGILPVSFQASAAPDFSSACEVRKICADVQPGGGRIFQCLKDHKSTLSDKCKLAIGEFVLNQPGPSLNRHSNSVGEDSTGSARQKPKNQ